MNTSKTHYHLTFYSPEGATDEYTFSSDYGWVTTFDRNELIKELADLMVRDTNRQEGAPLYEYDLHINGKLALSILTNNDTLVMDDPDTDGRTEYKDEVDRILLQASTEHDFLLQRMKEEAHIEHHKTLPAPPGPGRRG